MKEKILKLAKHTLFYGFGNVASRAIAFFLIPLYTSYLMPSDYGILQIVRTINYILIVILLMGMNSSMFRVYYNVQKIQDKSLVVNSTILTFIFFSSLILLPLVVFSSFLSKLFLESNNSQFVFLLLLFSIFLESFFMLQLAILRAEEKSKLYSLFTIIRVVLYTIFSIIFIAFLNQNYFGSILAGLISFFLIIIVLLPFTLKNFRFQISFSYTKEILHIGIPLAIGGLGIWILNLSDRFMLKLLLRSDIALFEVGLYSLGDKIASIIRFIIVMPFMLAWGSMMFTYSKEPNASTIYKTVLNYFSFIIGIVGLFISLFSKEIIFIMSRNNAYYDAYKVVPILIFSKILSGVIVVISVGVIITKKSKYVAITNISASLVNIILNFYLIKKYQMIGASLASLISYIFATFLIYYFSKKYLYVNWDISKIMLYFCFIFLIVISIGYLNFNIFQKTILFILILPLLPLFNVISYSEIKKGYLFLRNKL